MRSLTYKFLYLYLLLSLFIGCGEYSSNSYDNNSTDVKTYQKNIKIYGYVVDNYVKNATVFIDTNLNNILDDDEVQTKTLSNGYYELYTNHIPVSNEIEITAYGGDDIVSQTPLKGILKAQFDYINQTEVELNLTPLSTLAVAYKSIKYDAISIDESIHVVNSYAKANNLLNDPVKEYSQNPNDLKQNIKLHNLMLSLTKLQYKNQDKQNVYETYRQLAQNIEQNSTIDNINSYDINNTSLNISNLKETIFNAIENEDDINSSIPTILDDTSTNPENYIPNDNTPTATTDTTTTVGATNTTTTTTPTITPTPTNTPPIAQDLNITTDEDNVITSKLHASDDNNDTLTYIKVSNPSYGIVNIESNGTFTYSPSLNYNGTDTFTFKVNDGKDDSNISTVNITINPINDTPIAKDFNITNTNTGKTINWKLLSLALDAEDGNNLTAELNTTNQPSKGNVAITDENLTYTPSPNQSGNDTFKLNIKDTNNSSITISVHVTNIDTISPTITTPTIPNNHQIDTNLTITFSEDINISSYEPNSITLKEDNTTNTNYTYTFTNNKTLQIDANLTYSNSYTLNIQNLKDNVGNIIEQKEFTFTSENFIPVASDFNITNVGTKKTINWEILSDANDSTNDNLSAIINTNPSYGDVNISGDYLTYTPILNIDNSDTFKLDIKDNHGGVVTINVNTQDADTIAPAFTYKSPDINYTDFFRDENLTYKFSESIDISDAVISINPPLALTTSLTDDNKTLNIDPSVNLDYFTNYTLTLTNIKDTVGNILPMQTIKFTTKADIYYVSKTGSGSKDGSSWANANNNLQGAINIVSTQNNRQIWVKKGTYDISSTLSLKNSVYLYGGFEGNETKRKERDISANETILDGGGSVRILNAFSVTKAIIDGFTLQNGQDANAGAIYNTGSSYTIQNSSFKNNTITGVFGGAMYNRKGSMHIKNCYFYKNGRIGGGYGGAIINEQGGSIVENSNFEENYATNGAAIYLTNSNSLVKDCNFTNNIGTYGAVLSRTNDKSSIKNSIFKNNQGSRGGGFASRNNSSPTITNSQFIENNALAYGGAIYIDSNANLNIFDSNITNNTAKTNGGAICSYYKTTQTSINIKNVKFAQNSATSNGGAIYVGNIKELIIKGSNFTKNISDYGGAIDISGNDTNLTISDSNFTQNKSTGTATTKGGGSIYAHSIDNLAIDNATFTKNTARVGGSIYAIDLNADINNSNFIENSVTLTAGAVYIKKSNASLNALTFFKNTSKYSGAIGVNNDSNITLSNSTFVSNEAISDVGGVYILGNSIGTIKNCTFTKNKGHSSGGLGNHNSTVNISNSILWDNGTNPNILTNVGTTNVSYSIVQNGFAGGTNISSTDPRLEAYIEDSITYYYSLGVGSSAIDSGDDTNMTLPTDQIGNNRKNGTVDMGAIEKQ